MSYLPPMGTWGDLVMAGVWVPVVGRAAAAGRPKARSAVGRPGGWVREGVAPSRKGGSGVSPPRKF